MEMFNELHMQDGMWAYRWKGQYFRSYLTDDAHVDAAGSVLANLIPRDHTERKIWIQLSIQSIEKELAWRRECGYKPWEIIRPDAKVKPTAVPHDDYSSDRDSDGDSQQERIYGVEPGRPVNDRTRVAFMDVVPGSDMQWLRPDFKKSIWTYVLDLDERAFTVNGRIHFPMDNMPPGENEWVQYLSTGTSWEGKYHSHRYNTPGEYTMTLSRWSEPFLRPVQEHADGYPAIVPQQTSLAEWGVPQWNSLSISQALSARLLRIVLADHVDQLRNPDMRGERRLFNVVQWQMLCAAAPSLLIYPSSRPEAPPSQPQVPGPLVYLSLRSRNDENARAISPTTPHYRQDRYDIDGWDEKASWWFRGCLITFCRRLDQPNFVKAAIFKITWTLKRSCQKDAIGLLFSGQHVVGVALDGFRVRHTPALLVYDRDMQPQEGALLIMHLLSPVLTVNKTPWAAVSPRQKAKYTLPHELVDKIMQLVDYKTYMRMPFVSHAFRSIYLEYPRMNDAILMRVVPGGFRVRHCLTWEEYDACLVRKEIEIDIRDHNKCFRQRQLGLDLGFHKKKIIDHWGSESERMFATFKKDGQEYRSDYELNPHVVGVLKMRREMPEVVSQVVEGQWELERGVDPEDLGRWRYLHLHKSVFATQTEHPLDDSDGALSPWGPRTSS